MRFRWPKFGGVYGITPRGNKVYLRKKTWYTHICTSHPEIRSWIEEVLETLEKPEAIYDDRGTFISYRWFNKKGKFLMVVYSIFGSTGSVKTAYSVIDYYSQTKNWNKVWWPR